MLKKVGKSLKKTKMVKKGDSDDGSDSIAKGLISEVKSTVELFCDQNKVAHAIIDQCPTKIGSKDFEDWLAKTAYDKFKTLPSTETMRKVTTLLSGMARFEGSEYHLETRTVREDGVVWYDLGVGNDVVKITSQGWEVLKKKPTVFRNFNHQKDQVTPLKGGSLDEVFDFLNFPNTNVRLLYKAWLVQALIPGFPHCAAVIHGIDGSGKSTIGKFSKLLIDPSQIAEQSLSKDMGETVQTLSHHWLLNIDNLSKISQPLSDILCRAITGAGMSKRRLYTNDDDQIYSFRRVIILSGVNQVVESTDLLSRSLLMEVEKMGPVRTETELWGRFEERVPYLLGSLLDTLSDAMARYDSVSSEYTRFRMADAARWGCAVTLALGGKEEDYIRALDQNVQQRHQEALDANLAAQVLYAYMKHCASDEWTVTPSEMHRVLKQHAETVMELDTRTFPKQSNWLWKDLNRATNNLAAFGVQLSRERNKEERLICVTYKSINEDVKSDPLQYETANNAVTTVTTVTEGLLGNNQAVESIENDGNDSNDGKKSSVISEGQKDMAVKDKPLF